MRLIDADELEAMVKRLIELTPTVDPLTHETALDFLLWEGWLQEHDRILTESAVKRGRWIQHGVGHENVPWGFDCSECAEWFVIDRQYITRYRYCPNCGARMDGENDEID